MGLVSGIVVYIVIWWLSLFLILPFGIKQPEKLEKGHMRGAPANPFIWRKLLYTTILAAILFIIYYFIQQSDFIKIQRSYYN